MMNGGKTELAEQAVVRRIPHHKPMPTLAAKMNPEMTQMIHQREVSLADPELVREKESNPQNLTIILILMMRTLIT